MAISSITNRNTVKFDTNIDGYYIDLEGNEQKIENMIQVVGGADGVDAFPISGSDFTASEVTSLGDVDTNVSYKGHGILYDKTGKQYAHKGQMVLRDGFGNQSPIASISNKVTTISERKNLDTYLKDYTLDSVVTTKIGLSLDQIVTNTESKSNPFGSGNILQAVRNSDMNKLSVSAFTVALDDTNHVWVVGKATVYGESVVELIDLTTGTVLDTSYAKTVTANTMVPVFLSYAGTLSTVIINPVNADKCDVAIYNSFFKRYFKKTADTSGITKGVHEIAVVVTSTTTPFVRGSIDVLVMGETSLEKIQNGSVILRDVSEVDISFDESLPNDAYVVILETEDFIRKWYSTKSLEGFTVKLERNYTGLLYWTVIYIG